MNTNTLDTRYLTKTFSQLVDAYCFEHGRINQEDKEITQKHIKKELQKRFKAMLAMLDDPALADHPEQIEQYFTREYDR